MVSFHRTPVLYNRRRWFGPVFLKGSSSPPARTGLRHVPVLRRRPTVFGSLLPFSRRSSRSTSTHGITPGHWGISRPTLPVSNRVPLGVILGPVHTEGGKDSNGNRHAIRILRKLQKKRNMTNSHGNAIQSSSCRLRIHFNSGISPFSVARVIVIRCQWMPRP